MPAPKSPEFRQRAVELARLREKPVAAIAKDLGISESCVRRWMDRADVEEGHKEGLSKDERAELVRLRRENRVAAVVDSFNRRWSRRPPPACGSEQTTDLRQISAFLGGVRGARHQVLRGRVL